MQRYLFFFFFFFFFFLIQELIDMVWKQHMEESGSKIVEIFHGMSISQTYCGKCEDAEVMIVVVHGHMNDNIITTLE